MVHIRRIDVKGFKTFNNKVSLNLDKGLTVITGPNGSGKSNIMDAIKFSLGELSPKELRGSSFEDVISKTGKDQDLKSAYVAIQFDNTDRRIPIDSDYVTVSRQYVKGGEGVYRLNGKRVSRRQINDALSSTGLNISGINIIPQGAVTRLAEITPEERRKIIEDMVGIGVFDDKKADAKTHLQQAEINIRVASAKVEEVRSRVESLEKERNDLIRGKFLKEEIKELQAKAVSRRVLNVEEELSNLLKETARLKETLERTRREKENLVNEKQSKEEGRNELDEEKADLTQESLKLERKIAELTVESARIKVELQETQNRIIDLKQFREKNHKEENKLTDKKQILEKKTVILKEERSNFTEEYSKLDENKQTILKKIENNKNVTTGLLTEIEGLDKQITQAMDKKRRTETKINHEKNRLDLLTSQIMEAKLNLRKNEQQVSLINEKLKASDQEVNTQKSHIVNVKNTLKKTRTFLITRRNALEEAKTTLENAKETKLHIQTGKKAMEEAGLEEAHSEVIEQLKKEKIRGIKGTIASLIKIKPGYRRVLELAAEGWLNAILVKDLKAAVSCIEITKKNKYGRHKIIPLSRITSTKPVSLDIRDSDLLGMAVDLLECSKETKPALNFILGDTVVVKTRSSALLMSMRGYRAITQEGDIFEPEGPIETGYRKDLNLWDEIDEEEARNLEILTSNLFKLVTQGEEEIARLNQEINGLQKTEYQTETKLQSLQQQIKDYKNRLIESQKYKDEHDAFNVKLKHEISGAKNEISNLNEQNSVVESKLKELNNEKKELLGQIRESGVEDWEKEVLALSTQLDELGEKIHEADRDFAVSTSELKYLIARMEELQKMFQESGEEIEKDKETASKLQNKILMQTEGLGKLKEKKKRVTEKILNIDRKRQSLEERIKNINEDLENVFKLTDENAQSFSKFREQLKEREIEKSFLIRDLENLGFKGPLEVNEVDVAKTQEAVMLFNRELDEIGAVNELAEQQYSEYMGNYKQLSTKISELEEEKIAILRFMSELDQKKRKAFLDAFTKVENNFIEIFSRITNGGSGRLVLENTDDPFSGGIELMLRFPGKREFSISGASGGEKSVATVCLIIAMQAIQPMPFYMFDEIDAHLDPINAQRLSDLLKERSEGCQFIIISLKDTTISRADKVYGIYVEKGASRILSLPLPEMAIRDGR